MAEGVIERYGDKVAKENGFLVRKVAWIGRVGAPDKLYSRYDTGPFLVEYKDTGKIPRPTQVKEIERLVKKGITVHVIDSMEAVDELFTSRK